MSTSAMERIHHFQRHKVVIRSSLTLIGRHGVPSKVAPLILFKLFNGSARYTRRSLQLQYLRAANILLFNIRAQWRCKQGWFMRDTRRQPLHSISILHIARITVKAFSYGDFSPSEIVCCAACWPSNCLKIDFHAM